MLRCISGRRWWLALAAGGLAAASSWGATLGERLAELPPAGGTVRIDSPLDVPESLTVPPRVTLEFSGAGRLEVASGATLTVNGAIAAPAVPIFAGGGAVNGRIQCDAVPVQWFGADGADEADDTEAIRRAAELAREASGRKLLIPSGRYAISGDIAIRCNVECLGVLVKTLTVDETKTKVSPGTFTPLYYAKRSGLLKILPDREPIPLAPADFGAVAAGSFRIPKYAQVKTLDPKTGTIDLAEGGTLAFTSTDFYSSRKNLKGDEFYTPNDYCQLVSPRGDVFPEFCFSYGAPAAEAPAWDAARNYRRGEYCTVDGALFKATFPSGPGSAYTHPKLGRVEIGPRRPDPGVSLTAYSYAYANGVRDEVKLWVKVAPSIEYTPPQPPITINGLAIEILGGNPDGRTRPVYDSTLLVNRSNVTFNRLSISCKDRFTLPSVLSSVTRCASVVFNDCRWSGATQHGLGYNIMHGNVAGITYNNCISVNARDAMAGRHGKNITINGGHYGCIDDHYGLNYTISNAHISSLSTFVPGYLTPQADVAGWEFRPRQAIIIGGGGNVTIENCRFYNTLGIFLSRTDIGDLGGSVVIRDCFVRSDADFHIATVMTHPESAFDYAHPLLMPRKILIDNVTVDGTGRPGVRINHNQGPAFPLVVRNVQRLGNLELKNVDATFLDCGFDQAKFSVGNRAEVNFLDCTFAGDNSGLTDAAIGRASGNLRRSGARLSWSLNYFNPERWSAK